MSDGFLYNNNIKILEYEETWDEIKKTMDKSHFYIIIL